MGCKFNYGTISTAKLPNLPFLGGARTGQGGIIWLEITAIRGQIEQKSFVLMVMDKLSGKLWGGF